MPTPFRAPSGLKPQKVSLMLDTNVWRYLVDEGKPAVLALKRIASQYGVQIVACPAVVYEVFRTGDQKLRNRMVWALTLGNWSRLMPEAYREAAEVYELVAGLRPEWIAYAAHDSNWYHLQADWNGGNWWRRARQDTPGEARRIASLGESTLQSARTEAQESAIGLRRLA